MEYDKKLTLTCQKLINKSIFTKNQIEILLDYLLKKNNKIRISNREWVLLYTGKRIKKGVYFRILKQAVTNLKKIFFSMILLSYLKITSHHDITKLMSYFYEKEMNEEIENAIENIELEIERMIRGL